MCFQATLRFAATVALIGAMSLVFTLAAARDSGLLGGAL
jgi:hypothetical protein